VPAEAVLAQSRDEEALELTMQSEQAAAAEDLPGPGAVALPAREGARAAG
jgi:hypothetical protein